MDAKDIESRLKNGYQVTPQEWAFLLANNPAAFAAFMIENNPGSVRDTLARIEGYGHLDFVPNKKQLARQLQIVLEKRELSTWRDVVKNFRLITDGMPPEFINALSAQFNAM